MTIRKALLTVLAATVAFTSLGAVAGFLLGTLVPNYYRDTFPGGRDAFFDTVQVGFGQGATQGLAVGVVVGLLIVVVITWQTVHTARH